MGELRKWSNIGSTYFLLGDNMVLCGMVMYSYDDDCWKYAPDIYMDFIVESAEGEVIPEEEARKIIESNGGTGFDKRSEYLVAVGEDGKISGIGK